MNLNYFNFKFIFLFTIQLVKININYFHYIYTMLNKILRTPVDDLVDILNESGKVKISSLVSKLKIPTEYIERWLVILEEYGIIKLKYVGFEGYASIVKKQEKKKINGNIDIDKLKESFLKKSHLKNLSSEKIEKLWVIFLEKYNGEIKNIFEEKAKSKGYTSKKIELAWLKYKQALEVL